jgi:hypothetical protein
MENHGGNISTLETPNLFTRALWQSNQQSDLVANEEIGEGNDEFSLISIYVHSSVIFMCRKILQQGADVFNSPRKEDLLQIFIPILKSIALAGFEPMNLGDNGKHVNHYTTEVTVRT